MPSTTELALTAAAVALPSLLLARAALRSYLMRTYTGLPDLANVGAPVAAKRAGTAVVCGGSVAGLAAARVLRDHFARVVVLEPEAFTFTPAAVNGEAYGTREVLDGVRGETYRAVAHSRSRVWQYCAMHVFQILLTRFLRKMFVGFDDVALAAGIKILPGDFRLNLANTPQRVPMHKYADADHQILYSSRRTFETVLRRLVKEQCPTVEFVHGTATAFNLDEKDSAIRSVSYRDAAGAVHELESALVVDCTGNTQAGLKLLSRVVALPAGLRQEYNPKMFYASLELPAPPNFDEDLKKVGMVDQFTGEPADTDKMGWFMSLIPDPADDYRTLLLGRRDGDNGASAGSLLCHSTVHFFAISFHFLADFGSCLAHTHSLFTACSVNLSSPPDSSTPTPFCSVLLFVGRRLDAICSRAPVLFFLPRRPIAGAPRSCRPCDEMGDEIAPCSLIAPRAGRSAGPCAAGLPRGARLLAATSNYVAVRVCSALQFRRGARLLHNSNSVATCLLLIALQRLLHLPHSVAALACSAFRRGARLLHNSNSVVVCVCCVFPITSQRLLHTSSLRIPSERPCAVRERLLRGRAGVSCVRPSASLATHAICCCCF